MSLKSFFQNIFDDNQKALNQYQAIVEQINAFEPKMEKLSDEKLAGQTAEFKKRIAQSQKEGQSETEILEELLPEAFAVVREASKRILGMRHFDVQLIAGIALHRGQVSEQKTGEGKTLTVTAPIYLNALLGHGTHLITVNDYLAEVGAGWMGQIYHFLGLSTAVIVHDHARLYNPEVDSEDRGDERLEHFEEISRQEAYAADITYGTNNEFGFDYLRDNMVRDLKQMVQRTDTPHFFTIVDEADSILIDEARTPLIISAPDAEPTQKYYQFAQMVEGLTIESDFKIDEKSKTATLTDLGVKRLEQKLGVKNLYEESFETIHFVENALKAKTLYHRDTEYIVRDDQVIIVDEHTGRLMYGRRYADGLHQAIEAKEGVKIQNESRTLATISLQNYFRLYEKMAGMTGTAATEAEEFKKIYGMDVLVVPTNLPNKREDLPDVIYKTAAAKYTAITTVVKEIHQTGRPILLGTRSIEHNQIIANHLKKMGVPHQVLNAKNNEKEAFIIAEAGKKGAITVATNIAGRGVDIVLGGAKPELKDFRKKGKTYDKKAYESALKKWQEANHEVVALGGLHIIGTERHESRRIDNQLRGRSGRQGDPGSSQFFVSLDDEIMRVFGGEKIAGLMTTLQIPDNQPIEHAMISKSIENAQVKVEGFFFDQRKRLVDFDDVMNKHREIIYRRRRKLLDKSEKEAIARTTEKGKTNVEAEIGTTGDKKTLHQEIMGYVENEVRSASNRLYDAENPAESIDLIINEFIKIVPFDQKSQFMLREKFVKDNLESEQVGDELMKIAESIAQSRLNEFGAELNNEIEKFVVLSTLDEKWMDHLDQMDDLRDGIWLRGDKNTVLAEYQKEAFAMFDALMGNIEQTVARRIFRLRPQMKNGGGGGVMTPPPVKIQVPGADATEVKSEKQSIADEVASSRPPTPETLQKVQAKARGGNVTNLFAQALSQAKNGEEIDLTGGGKPRGAIKQHKIGRNDPCYCGSGKKYKKCHMLIDEVNQKK